MNTAKDKKNIHSGHRERLLKLALSAGLESMNEVQVLEFILSLLIPRIDTNPIAHRLLEEFGNVHSVLDATPEELVKIKGIGKRTANLLSLFTSIFSYYKQDKIPKNVALISHENCRNFFSLLLEDKNVEELYIVALNVKYKVIRYKLLTKGNIKNIGLSTHAISQFITGTKAAFLLLGHNHPGGNAEPSQEDKDSTQLVEKLAGILGIKVLDHLIFGQNGVYSMKHEDLIWAL